MADTGIKHPSTTGFAISGTTWSYNAFSNPTNAYASDNTYATYTTINYGNYGQTYGGFDFQLPQCTIDGIEFNVEQKSSSGTAIAVYWFGNRSPYTRYGTVFFNNPISTAENVYSHGGATNLCGRTDWNQADFADGSFYFMYSVSDAPGTTISLDDISMKIYYTPITGSLLPFLYP